ncbi:MAG: cytochrome c biogenesis protein [Planctomycetota bacterium]|jgi:ABC-type transport system involved in cytochrome c biogenesis permease subunit
MFSGLSAPLIVLVLAAGGAASAQAPAPSQEAHQLTHTWPAEVVDLARSLPVQDSGRIKPLDTMARFALLRIHGKRTLRLQDPKRKLPAIEWLLDCLFYPQEARKHEVFLIEDRDVLDPLGLPRGDKRKRDYYSFEFLQPARQKLMSLADAYGEIDRKERSPIQEHVVFLAHNYWLFERLTGFLDFARAKYRTKGDAILEKVFAGKSSVRFADILARVGDIKGSPKLLDQVRRTGWSASALAYIPPAKGEVIPHGAFQEAGKTWLSPWNVTQQILGQRRPAPARLELLKPWQRLVGLLDQPQQFAGELRSLRDAVQKLAEDRGEYWKIPVEVSFYKADYFYWGLVLFVLSFLLCACQWMWPRSKALYGTTWVTTVIPLVLLITGITIRSILRSRPPVSTLYETFLFITAVGVLVAVIIELINRKRVGQLAAAFFGALGLFLAMSFEELERQDTMPTLVAVLDTNFWLATHVTTVTMGYAASLLPACIGAVYLLCKLFGIRRGDRQFYKDVSRMTYGAICFGVLFSTIGTILGGVWANDSWGRFWGWDPKENGALMIVLAQLAILHARLGGYLREFGLCLVTPLLGIIVVFSWFHVNLLGVGLHAYGFSSKLALAVWISYGILGGLFCLGVVARYIEEHRQTSDRLAALEAEKAAQAAGQVAQAEG